MAASLCSSKRYAIPAHRVKKLGTELRRIKSIKGQLGSTGEEGVSAKLTRILKAFNKIAKSTKLDIEKITITTKNITITGSTSSRSNTLKMLQEVKSEMVVQQERLGSKDNRDTFSITVVPKKPERQK